MAIRVDRPRFRGIFGRMRVEAPPAEELLDAFEETLDDAIEASREDLATKRDLELWRAEIRAEMQAMETRIMNRMYVALGVLFMALAALMALLQVFGD